MGNSNEKVVGKFIDKYGEERTIRGTRHGLQILRKHSTFIERLGKSISPLIKAKIKEHRIAKGMTLEQLAYKSGLVVSNDSTAKIRMWEIENETRKHGIRIATLYAIAMALEIPIIALMPTAEEVKKQAFVSSETIKVPVIKEKIDHILY